MSNKATHAPRSSNKNVRELQAMTKEQLPQPRLHDTAKTKDPNTVSLTNSVGGGVYVY
jgi:hypothetical protein